MSRINGISLCGVLICLWFSLIALTLGADEPTKQPAEPPKVPPVAAAELPADPAFDRYIDWDLLGDAWAALDSQSLADVAMQVLHGEHVLGRSRHGLKTEQLFDVTTRLAADNKDAATLQRLKKGAEQAGKKELADRLAAAEALLATSRGADTHALLSVEGTTAEQFAAYKEARDRIRELSLLGNREELRSLQESLKAERLEWLTTEQTSLLRKQTDAALAALSDAPPCDAALASALELLAAESRDPRKQQADLKGGPTPWNVRPTPSGPGSRETEIIITSRDQGRPGSDATRPGLRPRPSPFTPPVSPRPDWSSTVRPSPWSPYGPSTVQPVRPPVSPRRTASEFSGRWQLSWTGNNWNATGPLDLMASSNGSVQGSYTYNNGAVQGTVQGRLSQEGDTLIGQWSEWSNDGQASGDCTLWLTSAQAFSGRWSFAATERLQFRGGNSRLGRGVRSGDMSGVKFGR